MPTLIPFKQRVWAFVVHAPIITLIWVCYIVCRLLRTTQSLQNIIAQHIASSSSLPITPLLFSVMTIPISLFVYQAQRRSPFVKAHATQAYVFNVSLIRWYVFCLAMVIASHFLCAPLLANVGLFVVTCASINCFVQATLGMRAAVMGVPFNYYFVSRLFPRRYVDKVRQLFQR